jgi:hypothetical protein
MAQATKSFFIGVSGSRKEMIARVGRQYAKEWP